MIINGVNYDIAKLASQYKLSITAVRNRLRRNIPLDMPSNEARQRGLDNRVTTGTYIFKGKQLTPTEIAKEMGYSVSTFYARKNNGIPFDIPTEDLKTAFAHRMSEMAADAHENGAQKVDFGGTKSTVWKVAKTLDVCTATVRHRLRDGKDLTKLPKMLIVTDKGNVTVKSFADSHNISTQAVYDRIKSKSLTVITNVTQLKK